MRNSFGANTPATRGFPGQTTRPFGSGGAEWNLVNEGAVGALILYGCGKGADPLPYCGSDGNRGLILFREVNDLIWTPEASTLFGLCFLRICRVFPAVLLAKNADVSGVRFCSFTSRKSIRPRFVGSGESLSWMPEMYVAADGSPEVGCSAPQDFQKVNLC